jgi:hypothetical protein
LAAVEVPNLVIIDADSPVPNHLYQHIQGRGPLVVKLSSGSTFESASERAAIFDRIRRADAKSTNVLNLLPQRPEDALPWGFDPETARNYATNGKRIDFDLTRYGYKGSSKNGSKAQIISSLLQSSPTKKTIVLVGEAGPDGFGVRIPGSKELLTNDDLKPLASDVTLLALVCNSHSLITGMQAASVVGVVYTDESRKLLKLTLDHRPPATSAEYFDIVAPQESLSGTLARFAGQFDQRTPVLVFAFGPANTLAASLAIAEASPTPPITSSPRPSPSASVATEKSATNRPEATEVAPAVPLAYLFLAGIVGGALREVIRWKRLRERKRDDLYAQPPYLLVSGAEVLMGGVVGIFFANVANSPSMKLIICFVVGAGIEALVRKAAKLEIWTPSIPQGPSEPRPATMLEYLRA